jgi:hypothetical protein
VTDKTRITEIAPDHYVISIYVREFNLRFNHFLIKDDEPLLFHTGMKQMFPLVRDAVARVINPATLRWISFSHFEADECGALNEWLAIAPQAAPVCGLVGAVVSVNDFAVRPAHVLAHDEILKTGAYRFRYQQTPHVPHNWEAGLLFEEVTRTLLCSDLFTHEGDVEPMTKTDVVDRAKQALLADVFEAVIAAIYLDGGIEPARAFVERQIRPLLADVRQSPIFGRDHKSALQERLQGQGRSLPTYRIASESGPDHQKVFHVDVRIDGQIAATGTGRTKKDAEQEAARLALENLAGEGSRFE